jgi:hypothetical protein
MKNLASVIAVLSVAACTDDGESLNPTPLAYDAYFIAVFAPHTSPQDCLDSPDPRGCRFAITLCKDGRAAERIADIVRDGSYDMIDNVAHVTINDYPTGSWSFEFDVVARVRSGDSPNTSWIFDTAGYHQTLQFDTIDCAN